MILHNFSDVLYIEIDSYSFAATKNKIDFYEIYHRYYIFEILKAMVAYSFKQIVINVFWFCFAETSNIMKFCRKLKTTYNVLAFLFYIRGLGLVELWYLLG